MDNYTIFTKTAKGLGETLGKTKHLAREQRKILKEIDGKACFDNLVVQLGMDEAKLMMVITKLLDEDYIREFGSAAPRGVRASEDTVFDLTSPATIEAANSQLTIGDFFRAMEQPSAQTQQNTGSLDFKKLGPAKSNPPRTPALDAAAQVEQTRRAIEDEALRITERAQQAAETARRVAELQAQQGADRARQAAEAKARQEAEHARRQAILQEQARAKQEAEARRQAEDQARKAAEEAERQARIRAEQEAQRLAQEAARREAQEQERRQAEERAQREAEMAARKLAEDEAQRQAQEHARQLAEEAARLAAEAREREEAEERARQRAEEEARLAAEARAREEAEAQARREAEELARRQAEEDAHKLAQEQARIKAWEAARRAADELAQKEAQAKAKAEADQLARLQAEEEARQAAEAQARRQAEEAARRAAEEEAQRQAAELARQRAEEAARLAAEEQARREAEEQAKREARERAKREAEEAARLKAEEKARQKAEAKARKEAEAQAKREAKEQARREAEERARVEAEQKALEAAAAKAKKEAEAQAKREAKEQARQAAEAAARQKAEEAARVKLQKEAEKAAQKAAREAQEAAHAAAQKATADAAAAARAAGFNTADAAPAVEAPQEFHAAHEEDDPAASTAGKPRLQIRLPFSLGKLVRASAVAVTGLSIAGLGLVHVLPFPERLAELERQASAQFGQPVKIGSLNLALLPQPRWRLQEVAIGADEQITIPEATATIALASLASGEMQFKAVNLVSPVVDEEGLGWILFGESSGMPWQLASLKASNVKLNMSQVPVPNFDASAEFDSEGGWRKILLNAAADKLHLDLQRTAGKLRYELTANEVILPFGGTLVFDTFTASGTLERDSLELDKFTGLVYDGSVSGSGTLRWKNGWSLKGEAQARRLAPGELVPGVFQGGVLDGSFKYAMQAGEAAKLFTSPQARGSFGISSSVLMGVDLASQVIGQSGSGKTTFNELNGDFSLDGGKLKLTRMRLAAGLLSAAGDVAMDADGKLNGHLMIDLRTATRQAHSSLSLAGTAASPKFNR